MKLGLVGLPGSGKTTITLLLEEKGFDVVNCDKIGHHLLNNSTFKFLLKDRFGPRILTGGFIDRVKLGEIVFRDQEGLNYLNGLLHPEITREAKDQLSVFRNAVVEAALLFQLGLHHEVDHILLVEAPFELRLERVQRRGWSFRDLRSRDQAQKENLVKYRDKIDLCIYNSGDDEHLRQELEKKLNELDHTWSITHSDGNTVPESVSDIS